MRKNKYFKALSESLQSQADEKAGYPPNCNEGYVAKDGKCVPVEEDTEANKYCPTCYNKGGQVCEKGDVWDEKAGKCMSCPECKGAGKKMKEGDC